MRPNLRSCALPLALAAALLPGRHALAQAPVAAAPPVALAPDTSWVRRAMLYEVFVQDFSPSGNLRGVIAGLDRIQASGANTVWIMPVQPAGIDRRKGSLGSRYAIRDYRAVDPAYGSAIDFRALVQAIHARGMKAILDWVPDHTAWDHPWLAQHPDWYVKDEQGAPAVPRDPDGKPTDWTDVVQLDYRNPALRAEMIATMRWWLETFELDGFRVDVAGFVPAGFWREAIPALRGAASRPLLFLAEWGDPWVHEAGFDLSYGWAPYSRLKAVWKGAPASTFVPAETTELATLPNGGARLRFTTNHDETAWDQPPVTLFGGAAGARAAFVATALLPGRPLLYNGQEVESPQKLGLFEREAIAWKQPDAAEARAFYRRVLGLAQSADVLRGEFAPVATTAAEDVIAYRRGGLLVLVNARPRAAEFVVQGVDIAGARDMLTGRHVQARGVRLPAYGALVLRLSGR